MLWNTNIAPVSQSVPFISPKLVSIVRWIRVFHELHCAPQWCFHGRDFLGPIKALTLREGAVSLNNPHGFPVQEEITGGRRRIDILGLQMVPSFKLKFREVAELMAHIHMSACGPPWVRDSERGGEKDPELPIKRFDNRAAQNRDQLPVKVGVRPREAAERKDATSESCQARVCDACERNETRVQDGSPVAAVNHCLQIHQ